MILEQLLNIIAEETGFICLTQEWPYKVTKDCFRASRIFERDKEFNFVFYTTFHFIASDWIS